MSSSSYKTLLLWASLSLIFIFLLILLILPNFVRDHKNDFVKSHGHQIQKLLAATQIAKSYYIETGIKVDSYEKLSRMDWYRVCGFDEEIDHELILTIEGVDSEITWSGYLVLPSGEHNKMAHVTIKAYSSIEENALKSRFQLLNKSSRNNSLKHIYKEFARIARLSDTSCKAAD